MTPLRLPILYLSLGWLYILFIFYICLTPQPPVILTFDESDKLEHLGTYSILMFGFCQVYRSRSWRLFHALCFISMGIGIEFLQRYGGQRSFEVADMCANAAGVMLGWAVGGRWDGLLQFFENKIFTKQ